MKFFSSTAAESHKKPWTVTVILGLLLLLMRLVSAPGSAQSPSTEVRQGSENERILEISIPKNVPISVKVKKEKEASFKSMTNEKWVREFELELTNTGDKPIYAIHLEVLTGVKGPSGYQEGFGLYYGRVELGSIRVKASPDDIPIKPGETYVFAIHPNQVSAWERLQVEQNWPQPKRIKLLFQTLSFGDGTGFINGTPIPNPWKDNQASLVTKLALGHSLANSRMLVVIELG